MRPEIEIFSFYPPCVGFPDNMLRGGNVFSAARPIIGIITFYRKDGKFFHQERTAFIRSATVMPCEYHAAVSLDGIPCPSLILFVSDITPELIGFGFRPYFNLRAVRARRKERIHFGGSFFSIRKSRYSSRCRDFSLCPRRLRR